MQMRYLTHRHDANNVHDDTPFLVPFGGCKRASMDLSATGGGPRGQQLEDTFACWLTTIAT